MQEVLISEDRLKLKDSEISQAIKDLAGKYLPDISDSDYGSAFRYFLLFEHCPEFVCDSFGLKDPCAVFYNKYFWFCRFAALYAKKHGPDDGIQQQRVKMVDGADCEIDFTMIFALMDRAQGK